MWTYSPVPEVENALQDIRQRYPATYPTGLDRIHRLLEKLGNPQHRLPFIFHAAGTNGKGSALAFLQAIFEAGGLTVHKFISPHLVRFEERIIISGEMITPHVLVSLVREVDIVAKYLPISFFEFFTVLSFMAFSRHPADVLLLETGMGGLYDATNVIEGKNIVSLLTRISLDHTHILGDTLPEIAFNKAGIIKPHCAAVVAPQMSADVVDVFISASQEKKSPLFLYGRDWEVFVQKSGFNYKSKDRSFDLPLPRLQGRHQLNNAGTALAALENSPFTHLMTADILSRAMEKVVWAGRMQLLTPEILPPLWELWIDGAHNDSGAEIMVEHIKGWNDKPLHLITAMKKNKNAEFFYQPLLPHISTVQIMSDGWTEAPMMPAAILSEHLHRMGHPQVTISPNLESAIRALAFQFPVPQRILVTGSLYLVGQALKEFL